MSRIAHDYMQMMTISKQKAVNSALPFTSWSATNTTTNADTSKKISARSNNKRTIEEVNESEEDYVAVLDDDEDSFGSHFNEVAGAAAAAKQEESEVSEDDFECDKTTRNSFQEYVLKQQNALQFTTTEVTAIKLLSTLHKTKAPLNMYESVMHWHLSTVGKIHSSQTVRQSSDFITREKLFKAYGNVINTITCIIK